MHILRRGAVVAIMVSLPVITAARVHVWGDPLTIWAEAMRHSPEKPRPWMNYGVALTREGQTDRAAWAFTEALELAQRPERVRVEGPMRGIDQARLNLAIVHANAGRYIQALALTGEIQPRADHGRSIVNHLERQWRIEQVQGSSSAF